MKPLNKPTLAASSTHPIQGGFTLVEVMIASLVGLIVTLGILQINLFLAHNAAVQNGNSSFEQLIGDISLRLSGKHNLEGWKDGMGSSCARTLGNGNPNPAYVLASINGPSPVSLLYEQMWNSDINFKFLVPPVRYGNVIVNSIVFNPIAQPVINSNPADTASIIGELTILAVRSADVQTPPAPKPTPTLTGNIPINITYSTINNSLIECASLASSSAKPITAPSCSTGSRIIQDSNTHIYSCAPL